MSFLNNIFSKIKKPSLSTVRDELNSLKNQNNELSRLMNAITPHLQDKKVTDGLINVISNLGTSKDKGFYNKYVTTVLNDVQMMSIYRSSWIGAKIVDIPAYESTREWREFTMQDDDGIIDRLQDAEIRFNLKHVIREAIKYSLVFGGAGILIGCEDSGYIDEPLDIERIKPGSLKFLHVIDRRYLHALPHGDEYYPEKGNFLNPEFYITQIHSGGMDSGRGFKIHRSRLVKFDGTKLPLFEYINNNFWGDSIFVRVFEAISQIDVVQKTISSLTQEINIDVWKIKDLQSTLAMTNGAGVLTQRIQMNDLMKSINNSVVLDKDNEDIERKQISFQGLDHVLDKFLMIVAAASNIPATKILGKAPEGMDATGDGDMRNFYDHISSIQEDSIRKNLEYLDLIMAKSELGYIPSDMKFEFRPLWQMSEKDLAEIQNIRAQRDATYLREGVLTPEIIAKQLIVDETYQPLTEIDVIELGDFGASEMLNKLEEIEAEEEVESLEQHEAAEAEQNTQSNI